jgi:hypothetical protein
MGCCFVLDEPHLVMIAGMTNASPSGELLVACSVGVSKTRAAMTAAHSSNSMLTR